MASMFTWLASLFGGDPLKSFTAWGMLLLLASTGAINAVCGQGVDLFSMDTCDTMSLWAEKIGMLFTVIGIRRRV